MYRFDSRGQLEFPDFYLLFSGHLDPNNRWISLAQLIPWKLAEAIYLNSLCDDYGAPADIRYPTDVSLVNEAREKTEELIDELHLPLVGRAARPRTYRVKARRAFVAFTKKKRPGYKAIRRARKQQLGYLCRKTL